VTGRGTIIDRLGRVLGPDVILDLVAVEPRSSADQMPNIGLSAPASFGTGAAPLMPNIWSLDLNVELQKTIKQRRFPVQAASDVLGCRLLLTSGFQKAEPP